MTSLTRYSSLFCKFLTGADVRRHGIRGDSIDGAAHFNIVIIASLAGILSGFDKVVIAGVTTARRIFFGLAGRSRSGDFIAPWGTLLAATSSTGPNIATAEATCRESSVSSK
jgi:hypothetical protein